MFYADKEAKVAMWRRLEIEDNRSYESASVVLSENADHAALNLDLIGGHDDRAHFGIGRLQANLSLSVAVEPFQSSFILSDECHHDVARVSDLGLLAHHIIAIHDVVFNH